MKMHEVELIEDVQDRIENKSDVLISEDLKKEVYGYEIGTLVLVETEFPSNKIISIVEVTEELIKKHML